MTVPPPSVLRVLVAEDDPAWGELTREAFAEVAPGIQVEVVTSGDRALAQLRVDAPDLLLLDLNLPGLDGWEVLRALQVDPGLAVDVVVLSGSASERDRELAASLGARACLTKPTTFPALRELAARLVGDAGGPEDALSTSTARKADLADLAYVVAHDLRSPLQAISGFADLLARMHSEALDERGRECVGFIQAGAARMDVLIEDLLAYCRAGAGGSPAVPVALDALLERVTTHLGTEIAEREASVSGDALPVVVGDPDELSAVLRILVANALKFARDDVMPVIRVSSEPIPGGWSVSVTDNGIGIDPSHRPRVFGMFQRLHPRERYDGTGAGLAIARRLVEGQGGAIWVEEAPGGGSRFCFTIPAEPLIRPGPP